MKLTTINPATEEIIKNYDSAKVQDIPKYINNSKKAFSYYSELNVKERCNYLKKISRLLLKNKRKYAELITIEMGKPIKESIAEIEKCSLVCDYYAENGEKFLEDEIVKTEYKKSYIKFQPLGTIACVMPWNFPFWQVFRFAIPALTVGNTIILRHSTVTLGCSEKINDLFNDIFPKNVFQNIICTTDVAEKLIQSNINGVSFTGSTNIGRRIGGLAGKSIKKFVLELGGSDPFIVLKDAELNLACESAIVGRFVNTGQSCIAAKRFIVHKDKVNEFSNKVVNLVKKLKVGNPLDIETQIGPLVRKEQLNNLEKQVNNSVKKGAKILVGGRRIKRRGYFYEPTVLTVKNNMQVIKEEVFGPVMPVLTANNDNEAINEANNSEYGLGASLWTKDLKKAEYYAGKIQTGFVSVNQVVRSDPRLPFGGIKNSGIGRELSRYGLLEFCNIKSVVIK